MDVLYQRDGLSFIWNAQKAAANRDKHGISFERASEVFFDPLARVLDADAQDESRDALLGATEQGSLLFVVHIERADEAIRIISARSATPAERTDYEDNA